MDGFWGDLVLSQEMRQADPWFEGVAGGRKQDAAAPDDPIKGATAAKGAQKGVFTCFRPAVSWICCCSAAPLAQMKRDAQRASSAALSHKSWCSTP